MRVDRTAACAPRAGEATRRAARSAPLRCSCWCWLQIYLGALVAGLRAGLIYNTWPLIDGALVPDAARLLFEQPWWRNLFENALTVQFDHRMVAYALLLFALLHAVDVMRTQARVGAAVRRIALAAAVTLQAALGIVTLLHQAPHRARARASGHGDRGADASRRCRRSG